MKIQRLMLNHAAQGWKSDRREWVMAKSLVAVIFAERFNSAQDEPAPDEKI